MPQTIEVDFDWQVEKPERLAECESAIERALGSSASARWPRATRIALLVTIGRDAGSTQTVLRVCRDVLVGIDGEAPGVVDDSLALLDAVDDALHDCGGHAG